MDPNGHLVGMSVPCSGGDDTPTVNPVAGLLGYASLFGTRAPLSAHFPVERIDCELHVLPWISKSKSLCEHTFAGGF